jgi:hypothetical protein
MVKCILGCLPSSFLIEKLFSFFNFFKKINYFGGFQALEVRGKKGKTC